jgi:hypothetical protein
MLKNLDNLPYIHQIWARWADDRRDEVLNGYTDTRRINLLTKFTHQMAAFRK